MEAVRHRAARGARHPPGQQPARQVRHGQVRARNPRLRDRTHDRRQNVVAQFVEAAHHQRHPQIRRRVLDGLRRRRIGQHGRTGRARLGRPALARARQAHVRNRQARTAQTPARPQGMGHRLPDRGRRGRHCAPAGPDRRHARRSGRHEQGHRGPAGVRGQAQRHRRGSGLHRWREGSGGRACGREGPAERRRHGQGVDRRRQSPPFLARRRMERRGHGHGRRVAIRHDGARQRLHRPHGRPARHRRAGHARVGRHGGGHGQDARTGRLPRPAAIDDARSGRARQLLCPARAHAPRRLDLRRRRHQSAHRRGLHDELHEVGARRP